MPAGPQGGVGGVDPRPGKAAGLAQKSPGASLCPNDTQTQLAGAVIWGKQKGGAVWGSGWDGRASGWKPTTPREEWGLEVWRAVADCGFFLYPNRTWLLPAPSQAGPHCSWVPDLAVMGVYYQRKSSGDLECIIFPH